MKEKQIRKRRTVEEIYQESLELGVKFDKSKLTTYMRSKCPASCQVLGNFIEFEE